jgi:hypothetical protein
MTDNQNINNSYNNSNNMDNDEISLKELIQKISEWYRFLLTKWKLIVLAGVIGGLIGFTSCLFSKTYLQSSVDFCIGR